MQINSIINQTRYKYHDETKLKFFHLFRNSEYESKNNMPNLIFNHLNNVELVYSSSKHAMHIEYAIDDIRRINENLANDIIQYAQELGYIYANNNMC